MIETIDRPKIIGKKPNETRIRLAEWFTRLTDKRIDLTKVERTIVIPFHPLASGYNGSIEEAMRFVDFALFNTWRQIQKTHDALLLAKTEQERGRLRDFFNVPLDDR